MILPRLCPRPRFLCFPRVACGLLAAALIGVVPGQETAAPSIAVVSVDRAREPDASRQIPDRFPVGAPEWQEVLATACRSGEHETAARALASGADPNDAGSPLALAAGRNDPELVELLISYGADASLSSTALPTALAQKNPRVAAMLLSAGADPNLPDASGNTPLGAALRAGEVDLARLMFRHGGYPDEFVEPSLATGDLVLLDALFQYGLSPDRADAHGNPLLVRAALDNRPDLAAFLLGKGADAKKPGKEGLTALHLAAVTRNDPLLHALLDGGADPNHAFLHPLRPEALTRMDDGSFKKWLQRDTGLTPLMLAASRGDTGMIKLLLEKGARRGLQTKGWKRVPVVFACDGEHVPAAKLLLGRNPAPDEPEYRVTITLSTQRAVLYKDDEAIRSCRVSTGRKGYATPTGKFVITDKSRDWVSTIYHVSMPFFMRLNCREIGMHAGVCPGYPASHGCIRMPRADVQALYSTLKIGDAVTIEE